MKCNNFCSPLSPPENAEIQAPEKLIATLIKCLLVVENFQKRDPAMITKMGIIELIIHAMLLLI